MPLTRWLDGIEPQAAGFHQVIGRLRRAPAQHRLDARVQLARAERLGQVVVGAGFQAGELVALVGARGQHDDRHVLRAPVGAQPARELDAAHAGQHPVEHDQVRQRGAHHVERLLRVLGAQGLVPGELEIARDELLYRRLVFDHQYRCAMTLLLAWRYYETTVTVL